MLDRCDLFYGVLIAYFTDSTLPARHTHTEEREIVLWAQSTTKSAFKTCPNISIGQNLSNKQHWPEHTQRRTLLRLSSEGDISEPVQRKTSIRTFPTNEAHHSEPVQRSTSSRTCPEKNIVQNLSRKTSFRACSTKDTIQTRSEPVQRETSFRTCPTTDTGENLSYESHFSESV